MNFGLKNIVKVGVVASAFVPVFAYAQSLSSLQNLLISVRTLINTALPVLVALALAAFFLGLVRYIFKSGGDKGGNAKQLMIGGILGLFVMIAVWGIVELIANNLGVRIGGSLPVPGVGGVTSSASVPSGSSGTYGFPGCTGPGC